MYYSLEVKTNTHKKQNDRNMKGDEGVEMPCPFKA
jgi:hypothetical protein